MTEDKILPCVDPTPPAPTHPSTITHKRPSNVGHISFGSGGAAMAMSVNESAGASSSGSSQAAKDLLKRDVESQVFEPREKRASRLSQTTLSQQPKRRRWFFELDFDIQEEALTPRQRVARFWSTFWRIMLLIIAFAILGGVIGACGWVPALSHAKEKANAEKEAWRHHHTAVTSSDGSRCQMTMVNDGSVTLPCSTMSPGSTSSPFALATTTTSMTSSATGAPSSSSLPQTTPPSSTSSSMPSSTSTLPVATPAPSSAIASASSSSAAAATTAASTQALSSLGA